MVVKPFSRAITQRIYGRGLYLGPDVQHINNPGYNKVRGPVFVGGLRAHFEF